MRAYRAQVHYYLLYDIIGCRYLLEFMLAKKAEGYILQESKKSILNDKCEEAINPKLTCAASLEKVSSYLVTITS